MKFLIHLFALFLNLAAFAQTQTPDKIYGDLFGDVQLSGIFPDGKTFVDAIPKKDPSEIVRKYKEIKSNPAIKFSLELFVKENFDLPQTPQLNYIQQEKDVVQHIQNLWSVLKRDPDQAINGSSLLPLPNQYIVPGGRFREVYYWDSYFTMLGLKESGETKLIESIIKNFSFMINQYGHIPNGNRTYYLSRSQPPFFCLMIELLADIKGADAYTDYLPALEKEYQYWMAGAEKLQAGQAVNRVVKLDDGTILNRYWDELDIPRQESYKADVETVGKASELFVASSTFRNEREKNRALEPFQKNLNRHLRAGAASGWDFSSRWFSDHQNITTIHTTDFIPVDLNCLMYQMEMTLQAAYSKMRAASPQTQAGYVSKAGEYGRKAAARKAAIEKYCWNDKEGFYADYDFVQKKISDQLTLAGMFPLFLKVASADHAGKEKNIVMEKLLRDGGLLTTGNTTGQQWDAPNGWAPLQWVAIKGCDNYGFLPEGYTLAERWVILNKAVYARTGKLMEKYNVVDTKLDAGGGEYPSQDGFGWTNGVLLALIRKYNL